MLNFDLKPVTPVLSLAGKLPDDVDCISFMRRKAAGGSRNPAIHRGSHAEQFGIDDCDGRRRVRDKFGAADQSVGGRAKSNAVELTVGSFYYYYYYYSFGFVERATRSCGPVGFNQTSYLTAVGAAAGPATASSFSATLNGTLTGWSTHQVGWSSQTHDDQHVPGDGSSADVRTPMIDARVVDITRGTPRLVTDALNVRRQGVRCDVDPTDSYPAVGVLQQDELGHRQPQNRLGEREVCDYSIGYSRARTALSIGTRVQFLPFKSSYRGLRRVGRRGSPTSVELRITARNE